MEWKEALTVGSSFNELKTGFVELELWIILSLMTQSVFLLTSSNDAEN